MVKAILARFGYIHIPHRLVASAIKLKSDWIETARILEHDVTINGFGKTYVTLMEYHIESLDEIIEFLIRGMKI